MAQRSQITLDFPAGGLDRRYSYQRQPPYTTPLSQNVWPVSSLDKRYRGGSRPGYAMFFGQTLGTVGATQYPVNLLTNLTYLSPARRVVWSDNFRTDGRLGGGYEISSLDPTGAPIVVDGYVDCSYDATEPAYVACRDRTSFDDASDSSVSMLVVPVAGKSGQYILFPGCSGTVPPNPPAVTGNYWGVAQTEFYGELTIDGAGAYSGRLVWRDGAASWQTYAFTGNTDSVNVPGIFRIDFRAYTGEVWCYWRDHLLLNMTEASMAVGDYVGFGLMPQGATGRCRMTNFQYDYARTDGNATSLVVSVGTGGGSLWTEQPFVGRLVKIYPAPASRLGMSLEPNLQAAEWGQKLFITVPDPKIVSGSDGVVTSAASGHYLASASVGSFNTIDWLKSVDYAELDYNCIVTNATGSVVNGVYPIKLSATDPTKAWFPDGAGGTGECSFHITVAPHVYDPSTQTLSRWKATTNKGMVPHACSLLCRYRDRLVMAGQADAPHVWYMGRAGDPYDWDYGASVTDWQRAVAGTDAEAGNMGQTITALIPFKDDYLIIGCEHSLWVMRGDPAAGGRLDNLSYEVGVLAGSSWCHLPGGDILIWSRDGLYVIPAGAESLPQPLSKDRLPVELGQMNPKTMNLMLAYDAIHNGVFIFATPMSGLPGTYYWLDLSLNSFWPLAFPSGSEPTCICGYRSNITNAGVAVIGCIDGKVRYFDRNYETDDGTEIDSYVVYGPIRMDRDYTMGVLTEIVGTLGNDSGNVTWSLHVADTHENAVSADAAATGTWQAGLNAKDRPRSRGGAMTLKLTNGDTSPWMVEGVLAVIKSTGKQRVD